MIAVLTLLTWPFCQYLAHVSSNSKSLCLFRQPLFGGFVIIFGHFRKEIFFFSKILKWGKYVMLKIWWIWKIKIWSQELVDGHQTVPYQPGALFFWGGGGGWGVNCLVVFPTHFNPNNSLLISLQIPMNMATPRTTPDFIFEIKISLLSRSQVFVSLEPPLCHEQRTIPNKK